MQTATIKRDIARIHDVYVRIRAIGADPTKIAYADLHYGTVRRMEEEHRNNAARAYCRQVPEEQWERIEHAFNEYFEKLGESAFEYNTEHGDAGDSYAFLVSENPCAARDRLWQYCEIEGINLPFTEEQFTDWANERIEDFEMKPGYWSCIDGGCTLDSFPVGEIEEQFELSSLAESIDWDELGEIPNDPDEVLPWDLGEVLHHYADTNRMHCVRYEHRPDREHPCGEMYYDAEGHFWAAYVSDSDIRTSITEFIIEQCR